MEAARPRGGGRAPGGPGSGGAGPAGAWGKPAARWGRRVRVASGWLLVLLGLGLGLDRGGAADETGPAQFSEEQVKAAILVAFARTTDWPPGTFPAGAKHFRIGIVGRDVLGEKATAIFDAPEAGKGSTARFSVVTDEAEARRCHILFVPRSERRRGRELLERLKGAPVLTVGESDDFLDQDGMVNLVPKQGAIKFEINLNPAKAVGLRIPAKVLGAALSVRGKYG